jgi:hypothetical protein
MARLTEIHRQQLLVCVVNALIMGEIKDQSVRGPVDGRS